MTEKNSLLILTEDAARYARLIHDCDLPNLAITACESVEEGAQHIEHCNIIMGDPAHVVPIMENATHLQWVQSTWAGVEHFLGPHRRTDYILTGVKA